MVGLLVRAEYLPYGVSGLDGLLRGEPFEHEADGFAGQKDATSRYRTKLCGGLPRIDKFKPPASDWVCRRNPAVPARLTRHLRAEVLIAYNRSARGMKRRESLHPLGKRLGSFLRDAVD